MKKRSYVAMGFALGALASAAVARMTTQDPVTVSPQYYAVRFENDRVRVLEYRLKPGEKEGRHTHPPGVVYSFNDTMLRSTLEDGKTTESAVKSGHVSWRESTTHALENIGAAEAHSLAFELKPCKPY